MEALSPAADVELYSSTALQSALHLYSSTALYTLHPLHPPSEGGGEDADPGIKLVPDGAALRVSAFRGTPACDSDIPCVRRFSRRFSPVSLFS